MPSGEPCPRPVLQIGGGLAGGPAVAAGSREDSPSTFTWMKKDVQSLLSNGKGFRKWLGIQYPDENQNEIKKEDSEVTVKYEMKATLGFMSEDNSFVSTHSKQSSWSLWSRRGQECHDEHEDNEVYKEQEEQDEEWEDEDEEQEGEDKKASLFCVPGAGGTITCRYWNTRFGRQCAVQLVVKNEVGQRTGRCHHHQKDKDA